MEKVFESSSKSALITFDKENNVFVCRLQGTIPDMAEYKSIFNTFLDVYPYDKYPDVIFDNLNLQSDPALGRAWFAAYCIPEFKRRIVDESKPKFALVEPKNLFQNTVIKILVAGARKMGYKLTLSNFTDVDSAMKWILLTKNQKL